MTGFNSQVGGGVYKIQFDTNNQKAYRIVQDIIRTFIDLENAQKVVVSKNENTTLVEECSVCGCPENTEV
jgi:hypothetical protein